VWEPGRTADPSAAPNFLSKLGGVGELHAAFFAESRTRGLGWYCDVGNSGPLGMTSGGW
jgi:hypothetical protein